MPFDHLHADGGHRQPPRQPPERPGPDDDDWSRFTAKLSFRELVVLAVSVMAADLDRGCQP